MGGVHWQRLFTLSAIVMLLGALLLATLANMLAADQQRNCARIMRSRTMGLHKSDGTRCGCCLRLAIVFWLTAAVQPGGSSRCSAESNTARSLAEWAFILLARRTLRRCTACS